MKTRNKNIVLFIAGVIFIALIEGASAQSNINATDYTNVTVTVSAETMIDIAPSNLNYTANPGEACGLGISAGICNETINNYYAIQVENIGSWNVTKIWFNVSQDPQSPFAVGAATFVDPGNFVALTSNETTNDFFFVDRKEYRTPRTIVYLRDPHGDMPANLTRYNYGRLHNASQEYFYMIDEGSNGLCNTSGISYIRIGMVPRTVSSIGSTDFFNLPSVNYVQINLTSYTGNGYAFAVGNISAGPLLGYAVAVENQTCAVRFCKWNKDFPWAGTFANYSFNGVLTPGDSLAKKIGIMVPYGTYTSTKTGQLTAIAIGAP